MNIEERVRVFVAQNFYVDPGAIGSETSLIGAGFVDSTGMLELIAFLESEYGIRVEDREMIPENLETLARIAAFVERKTESEPLRRASP